MKDGPCPACPRREDCPRWPVFCAWAASGDPTLVRHVIARSASSPAIRAAVPPPPPDYADRLPPLGGCCG